MVCPPGIRYPPSVVYAQVDLYPHHNVGQERRSYPCQYPQVERLVRNSKEENIRGKDRAPESESHGDVLGIGRRRMMQRVAHGSSLVQTRPVHRPAMICILDPVRPYQPGQETHQESHLTTTTCSQPLRYVTAAVRQCGGLKDKSQPTKRMLVVHSSGMLMLGRKGLGRDREAH